MLNDHSHSSCSYYQNFRGPARQSISNLALAMLCRWSYAGLSTAKPVSIRLVISRPNHRPIYQPTAHLSHITAVNQCILRPLTPADRQHNACGTADRGGGCTWQVLLQIYIDSKHSRL